jgi:ribonuclease P protein component
MRLSGAPAFKAVYDADTKRHAGPLTFFARPNGLTHLRLGLSVSRRVGNAVKRSRIKRLLREAFRTTRHQMPAGYDIVVVVRPHEPIRFAEYQQIMVSTLRALDQRHKRREQGG